MCKTKSSIPATVSGVLTECIMNSQSRLGSTPLPVAVTPSIQSWTILFCPVSRSRQTTFHHVVSWSNTFILPTRSHTACSILSRPMWNVSFFLFLLSNTSNQSDHRDLYNWNYKTKSSIWEHFYYFSLFIILPVGGVVSLSEVSCLVIATWTFANKNVVNLNLRRRLSRHPLILRRILSSVKRQRALLKNTSPQDISWILTKYVAL
jgi:hypothetical protein